MPSYVVEVYELHATKFRIAAPNRADAIRQVQDGAGVALGASVFIDTLNHKPFSQLEAENPGIIAELNDLGLEIDGDDETFVRSVEEE